MGPGLRVSNPTSTEAPLSCPSRGVWVVSTSTARVAIVAWSLAGTQPQRMAWTAATRDGTATRHRSQGDDATARDGPRWISSPSSTGPHDLPPTCGAAQYRRDGSDGS